MKNKLSLTSTLAGSLFMCACEQHEAPQAEPAEILEETRADLSDKVDTKAPTLEELVNAGNFKEAIDTLDMEAVRLELLGLLEGGSVDPSGTACVHFDYANYHMYNQPLNSSDRFNSMFRMNLGFEALEGHNQKSDFLQSVANLAKDSLADDGEDVRSGPIVRGIHITPEQRATCDLSVQDWSERIER